MAPKKGYKAMLLTSVLIGLAIAAGLFYLLWKVVGWSVVLSVVIAIVAGVVLGSALYFWALPATGLFDAKADEPSMSEAVEADKTTTFTWNGKSYDQASILAGFVAAPLETVECDGVPLTALAIPAEGSGYVCTSEGWKEETKLVVEEQTNNTNDPECGGKKLSELIAPPPGFVYVCSGTEWTFAIDPNNTTTTFTPVAPILVPFPTDTADSCPVAQPVAPGSAFNEYTFVQGQTYHLNLSLEGASAGVEGNLLFKATTTFTAQFDGASWSYAGVISDPGCQYCDETSGDYTLTLANVPQLTGLVEVLDAPCTTSLGTTTLPVHKLVVVP